jgi:hypothetical protein
MRKGSGLLGVVLMIGDGALTIREEKKKEKSQCAKKPMSQKGHSR